MISAAEKPRIVIICGPTGIGKTAVSIELAEHFGGEIVGADSMQVFRRLDIGTAKPTAAERARVAHHLVDVVDPDEPFDAVRYSRLARAAVAELQQRGCPPFVVGGTGLYIKALLHGLYDSEPIDPDIRKRLKKEAQTKGSGVLHRRLLDLDPATAGRLHPNDTHRVVRALETLESTGRPILSYQQKHGFSDNPYTTLKIGLQMDRETLYDRINQRVEAMLAEGFVDEVRGLLRCGYSSDLKPMQSLGYRQVVEYLSNRISRQECVSAIKRDHRRYAKRQLTWFRADREIVWFEPGQVPGMLEEIERFLT